MHVWSPDEVEQLIGMYKERELLWNHKCQYFLDRKKKRTAYIELADKFSCSEDEVRRKIHNLRNQVSQELKKCIDVYKRKKKTNVIDKPINFQSKWPYFNPLKFVIPGLISSSTHLGELTSNLKMLNKEPVVEKILANEVPIIEPTPAIPIPAKRKSLAEEVVPAKVPATGESDECDQFGEYVAFEIRTLKSEFVKRKLKNEIRKAIVRAAEEDEEYRCSNGGNSNTTPAYDISMSTPYELSPQMTIVKEEIDDFQFTEEFKNVTRLN